jgi:hypothetical protein
MFVLSDNSYNHLVLNGFFLKLIKTFSFSKLKKRFEKVSFIWKALCNDYNFDFLVFHHILMFTTNDFHFAVSDY